jgi:hypothetical protein
MSISIYYTARRPNALSQTEQKHVAEVVRKYTVERKESEPGWPEIELSLYEPPLDTPDAVLEGATKLPDDTPEEAWEALQHWCEALSEIRRYLADAEWDVRVDDHDIPWYVAARAFDPSR